MRRRRLTTVAAALLLVALPPTPGAAQSSSAWRESFTSGSLDWGSPSRHGPELLRKVYVVQRDPDRAFLHARHDASPSSRPPAMHYGHAFDKQVVLLDKVQALKWRWRVTQHPQVGADPWLDLGASVYVIMEKPGLFSGGKGFKFGWLAKPGPTGTKQRGLAQVPLRSDAASGAWRSESVDLCALFRAEYGKCEGERVLYVGVVTDGDGTRSVAEGDYADFELVVSP